MMKFHSRTKEDHIKNRTKQMDVIDKDDAQRTAPSLDMTNMIKEFEKNNNNEQVQTQTKQSTRRKQEQANEQDDKHRQNSYKHGDKSIREAKGYW